MLKIIINFLFIVSSFFLTNCSNPPAVHIGELSDQLTLTYAKKMHEEYGLYLFIYNPSISMITNKIEKLKVDFSINRNVNIDEARKLLIPCIEKFIYKINNDKKIRSYLKHFPFTQNDVIVAIGFDDNNGDRNSDGSVAFVFNCNGKLFYDKSNPKTQHFEHLHEETFEEAQKIVNSPH